MPKDEFESLERRWRERPLFLNPPKRRPVRLVIVTMVVIAVVLWLSATGLPEAERLLEPFVDHQPDPPAGQTAQAASSSVALPRTHR
jgi:hypothetical protein